MSPPSPATTWTGRQRVDYEASRAYGAVTPEDFQKIKDYVQRRMPMQIWLLHLSITQIAIAPTHTIMAQAFLQVLAEEGYSGELWFYESHENHVSRPILMWYRARSGLSQYQTQRHCAF